MKAPLTKAQLAQIRADAANIKDAALRKNVTLDAWDEARELNAAKHNFDLGCWLFYYSNKVGLDGEVGLACRIDCALRLFQAGIFNPHYDFFTLFDFGERQFDTIFEMGDADDVIDALRLAYVETESNNLKLAFIHYGWDVDFKLTISELDKALALGFDSIAAMQEHETWLDAHGTPEFKKWKSEVVC